MIDHESALGRQSAVHIDPAGNRAARKYSPGDQVRRVLWHLLGWTLRVTPRPMFSWRNSILRAFGARIGSNVHVYPTARIYMPWNVELGDWVAIGEDALIYSLGKVRILSGAAISYRAHICAGTHDFAHPKLPLLKPPVVVEENAWIGTDAFIGPGVTIGKGAIVGARAVVVRDVAPLQIVGGNPARVIGIRKPSSSENA